MKLRAASLGFVIGTIIAAFVLTLAAIWLLNTGGANWKVLVAVWLWILPAVGLFGGAGYATGKLFERRLIPSAPRHGGSR
jgi:hypothetical protein